MARWFYEDVSDALVSFLPPGYRDFASAISGRNLKVWFGEDGHEHYEVQQLGRRKLEIGFHAEYAAESRNEAVLSAFRKRERSWRRALGNEAQSGPFVGRKGWRRLSEVWDGPGLDTEEAAVEAAERLARYITTLEKIRGST
ncbi:MAG TPA: hypothetical protein VJ818_01985 [Actinomycetota bacterium]|nr:hypothetical protein [Actinomycetota bacterium]